MNTIRALHKAEVGDLIRFVGDNDLGVIVGIGDRGIFDDETDGNIEKFQVTVFWVNDGFVTEWDPEVGEAYEIDQLELVD